jgi:hypothetical protein
MSTDGTQIFSIGVSHVFRLYSSHLGCMAIVKTRLPSVRVSHVSSPYAAQISCKSFVIIRISKLVESHFPDSLPYNLVLDRTPLNEFYHL